MGGERTADMAARFERDVLQAQPRAVIIWGLINDITRAEGDIAPVIDGLRANYEAMVRLALAQGIEPILATELTMGLRPSWRERAMATVVP